MTRAILPSPQHPELLISFKPESGRFIGLEWQEGCALSPSDKAAAIATAKASLFPRGFLRLQELIALCVAYEARHEAACSLYSDYQESHGCGETPESQKLEADIDAACSVELRARSFLAAYPASDAVELARKVVAVIGGHNLDIVALEDRIALRTDAARIIADAA